MKLAKYGSIAFFIVFLTAFAFYKKEAMACELISMSHFQSIQPDLFVDQSLDDKQKLRLILSLKEAISRVSEVYGKPKSSPKIIATANESYGKLGLNLTGMQFSGLTQECIFLGPKGLNVDVIAHELVHAELRHRTTTFTEFFKVPAWFIEGTGIIVDHRTPFLSENINLIQQDVIDIRKIFYLSDFSNTSVKSYQAAKVATEQVNYKSLYEGLERLNQGEQFEDVFGQIYQR